VATATRHRPALIDDDINLAMNAGSLSSAAVCMRNNSFSSVPSSVVDGGWWMVDGGWWMVVVLFLVPSFTYLASLCRQKSKQHSNR